MSLVLKIRSNKEKYISSPPFPALSTPYVALLKSAIASSNLSIFKKVVPRPWKYDGSSTGFFSWKIELNRNYDMVIYYQVT